MYTTIAFICLAAAIFMIKSDVIKQQIQLMRIIEIDKQEKDIEEEIPEDTEKDKDKEDEEQKEKEEKREKQEGLDGSTQGEV